MIKLWYCFKKDLVLSLKSWYIYTELIMAFVFVIILLFIVPENFNSTKTIYAYFDLKPAEMNRINEFIEESEDEIILLNSRTDVVDILKEEKSSIGMVVTKKYRRLDYEIILQGFENKKLKSLMKTNFLMHFIEQTPHYESIVTTSTLMGNNEKLSDRLNMLPVFLTLNASFMGLFIIASYIFLDKERGTIRALTVTPLSVWQYLISKVGLLVVSGLMSSFITTIFVAGTKANYIGLFFLLVTTNVFGSVLGLLITSFFKDMASAMGWMYSVIIILMFPSFSYYMPAFSPLALKLLPSYPMLFAYRELFFENGNLSYVYNVCLMFTVLSIIIFLIANKKFKKNLTI
ncbi:MAG: ABC transporter permease [Bacillota bacterium]|nr:ABC transporter permease [Bacillota bacterium]